MSFSPDSEYPCLLDRILGANEGTSGRRRGMTMGEYRAAVMRDLKWLLNSPQSPDPSRCLTWAPLDTASVHARDENLRSSDNLRGYRYPFVRSSVLNYGARSLAGLVTQGMDAVELERELKESIIHFEPRFIRSSVTVKLAHGHLETGKLAFEVSARLWALPHAEAVRFRSDYDLETGSCVIKELS